MLLSALLCESVWNGYGGQVRDGALYMSKGSLSWESGMSGCRSSTLRVPSTTVGSCVSWLAPLCWFAMLGVAAAPLSTMSRELLSRQ